MSSVLPFFANLRPRTTVLVPPPVDPPVDPPSNPDEDVFADWSSPTTNSGYSGQMTFTPGINCGQYPTDDNGYDPNQSTSIFWRSFEGDATVEFDNSEVQRFSTHNTVKFDTDSSGNHACRSNPSTERAEMHIATNSGDNDYNNLLGGPSGGNIVWYGWSQLWTRIDYNYQSTDMQWRNQCSGGSPATEFQFKPNQDGLILMLHDGNIITGGPHVGGGGTRVRLFNMANINSNVWYDFVTEIKYATDATGYVRVWGAKATGGTGSTSPLDFATPLAYVENVTTSSDGTCPHLRQGIYRWESSDFATSALPASSYYMTKHVSNSRWKFTQAALQQDGFNAVIPRAA